jgi:hypothetical protein
MYRQKYSRRRESLQMKANKQKERRMRSRFRTIATGLVLAVCALVSLPAQAADMDKGFYGFWDLDVSKSQFGPNPALKMGMVSWNGNGFAFAIVTGDGHIYTDGLSTRGGCWTIGLSPNWSCEIRVPTPKHVHLIMKQAGKVRRIGDIELLKNGTTQTVHQVFPEKGEPYVEKTIWVREPD